MNTNIDYWEKLVQNPSEAYKKLFGQEKNYLRKVVPKDSMVLDVGCGDGRNILSIVDIAGKVTGLDIDSAAVEDATNNLSEYSNVEILLGSAFDLPFEDCIFDVVILSMTLVNFDDKKEKALSELKRVTKNNGKIIISVYSEKAKNERLPMYEKIGVPIKTIIEGKFIFDESVGAHTSEQFSISDIENMVGPLGLKIKNFEEVDGIAYLLTLEKR